MVRFLISVLLAAAAASAFCARASATTEFCPAVLDIAPTGKAPAQTYGIQLRALSERRVTVRLAFDTSAGWYQTDVSEAELSPSIRTIPLKYPVDVPISASPVMYVRFPAAVTVNHAFIIRALSIGDVFHWSDRGQVTCPIAPEAWQDPQYSLADLRDLSAPPPHDATFLAATARSPLEAVSCPEPYARSVPQAQAWSALRSTRTARSRILGYKGAPMTPRSTRQRNRRPNPVRIR